MDMADEITRLQAQLEEAETDLQQSLSEVNQKVEAVDLRRRTEKAIKRHPLASLCLGATVGFALGSGPTRFPLIATFGLGMLLGLEIRSHESEEEDG